MKRILALVLALVVALGVVGCGTGGQDLGQSDSTEAPITYKELGAFVKSQLESKFEYTEITYDETGMTIFLSMDGISSTCLLAKTGNSEMAEPWNDILDSTVNLSSQTVDSFRSIGYADYVVSVVIVNDLNVEDIIAMCVNDELVYDAASAK